MLYQERNLNKAHTLFTIARCTRRKRQVIFKLMSWGSVQSRVRAQVKASAPASLSLPCAKNRGAHPWRSKLQSSSRGTRVVLHQGHVWSQLTALCVCVYTSEHQASIHTWQQIHKQKSLLSSATHWNYVMRAHVLKLMRRICKTTWGK